jgi:hypothetical protein
LLVLHGRGGVLDNRLSNLRYGTYEENEADKLADGTHQLGERNNRAKLTREQVLIARRLVASGPKGTCSRLARGWGVSPEALSYAVRGKNWAWLDAA